MVAETSKTLMSHNKSLLQISGHIHVGLWLLQASTWYPKAGLALSNVIHQFPFLGITGNKIYTNHTSLHKFQVFFSYSRFTIVKHEYINNNIRFLPGSIPERFERFNIRQPNTGSSKDTWRIHLGVRVPDRREKIKMDRFKRDLKHDHHIPHYFLHHDQDQWRCYSLG